MPCRKLQLADQIKISTNRLVTIHIGCGYGFGISLKIDRGNAIIILYIGPSSLGLRMPITICRVHDSYPRPMIVLSAWKIHSVAVFLFLYYT